MIVLRCAHCGREIEAEGSCPDHPDGVAVAVELDPVEGG